jgi:Holliday junction DNA helicase RuvA
VIARLRGEVAEIGEDRLCVDVHGVGYDVAVPTRVLAAVRPGEPVTLLVHTHVREDAILLYGFASPRDKATFELLLGISGIGPKLALACLSGMSAEDLGRAVNANDVRALSGIPGVGKKTAERMVLELRGKLAFTPSGAGVVPVAPTAAAPAASDPLVLALGQLGYRRQEIDPVLARLTEAGLDAAPLGDRVAAALRMLSGGAR